MVLVGSCPSGGGGGGGGGVVLGKVVLHGGQYRVGLYSYPVGNCPQSGVVLEPE